MSENIEGILKITDKLSLVSSSIVDGKGAIRVAKFIDSKNFYLESFLIRPAELCDSDFAYSLQTKEVRKFSINTGVPSIDQHIHWFQNMIDSPKSQMYIIVFQTVNAGILRVDNLDTNELEEDLFEFNELNINDLDVDLLLNILDQLIRAKAKSGAFDGRISGFNKVTQVNTLVDGNTTRIIRRLGNGTIDLDLINDYGYTINLAQGGIPVQEITTRDEDASNIINIYQSE